MHNDPIIQAKQTRSQQTQDKLLQALSDCLKEQFFEHISVAQITERAGVSVGTFYRRFKNKEALLPFLYQNFGIKLDKWVQKMERNTKDSLNEQVAYLVEKMTKFLQENAGIFRTLHLNARLYPEILPTSKLNERSAEYNRISAILMLHPDEINHQCAKTACDMAIFVLISNLIEKILYRELTPALASPISINDNTEQITLMMQSYLTANNLGKK
ncbi:TetR/AcrR family transcriptional regulator [Thalassotalea sp. M1531]|uniref:TetR/AcrR family transcriptional regulator n=1 Tax=Thalassotalea algicola TaxID=2716224 RepID=A0A7Y0Q7C6_9GAMM|nr:TetR/AcrR family transcriptional regulator [Thalassotalea algicola]NMP30920.1 TetR/AcrR family transcriptional regulator [Thalassotalea algicola]